METERVTAPPPALPSDASSAPGPGLRIDWVAALVATASTVVFLFRGFNGVLHRDVALYVYGAQRVLDGLAPYVGVLNRAGPLAHVGPAPGAFVARVLGVDDLLGMRVLYLAISVAVVVGIYLLCRDLFVSRRAGAVAALVFAASRGFVFYSTGGPREKTLMLLFVVFALHAAVRRRWAGAGALVALATLTWQPAFVIVIGILLLAVRARREDGWRPLVHVVLGGLAPTALVLVYYAVVASVSDFLLGFLQLNLDYTTPDPVRFTAALWNKVLMAYSHSTWLLVAGLMAFLVAVAFAAVQVARGASRAHGLDSWDLLLVGVSGLALTAWTATDFDGWPDALTLLPASAIGWGALSWAVMRRVRRPGAQHAVLAVVGVAALVIGVHGAVLNRSDGLLRQQAAARTVLEDMPPDLSMIAFQAPQPLALTGRTNPIRYQMFASGMAQYVDTAWPGGLEGLGDWVERGDFAVIAMQKGLSPRRLHIGEMIREDYVARGAPGWRWYIRADLVDENRLPVWAEDRTPAR